MCIFYSAFQEPKVASQKNANGRQTKETGKQASLGYVKRTSRSIRTNPGNN